MIPTREEIEATERVLTYVESEVVNRLVLPITKAGIRKDRDTEATLQSEADYSQEVIDKTREMLRSVVAWNEDKIQEGRGTG